MLFRSGVSRPRVPRVRKFGALLRDRLLRALGPYFAHQNVIYKLDGSLATASWVDIPGEFEFRRCHCADELPRTFWETYRELQPDVLFEEFARPFSQGALLSIGLVNGRPASYLSSLRSGYLETWYVPLEPNDIIIFSVVTFFRFRGFGLARLMI